MELHGQKVNAQHPLNTDHIVQTYILLIIGNKIAYVFFENSSQFDTFSSFFFFNLTCWISTRFANQLVVGGIRWTSKEAKSPAINNQNKCNRIRISE